jgi:pimeloyl-ACP methyl ester carboxylesterase
MEQVMSTTSDHTAAITGPTSEGTVTSRDGTRISYTRRGEGKPLILVDPAMGSRSFGPMPKLVPLLAPHFTVYSYDRRGRGASGDTQPYEVEREVEDIAAMIAEAGGSAMLYGISSGAALVLEAAKRLDGITKIALYEAPFIVDDSRDPMPEDFLPRMREHLAAGQPGAAIKMFMLFVGAPAIMVSVMRFTPVWKKLLAVAPTLPNDISILAGHQSGRPLDPEEFAGITVPACVLAGGKSPRWMQNGNRALADVLPNAQHQVLPGQTHMVKPRALAPALVSFLGS